MGFWNRLVKLVNPYAGLTVDGLLSEAQTSIGRQDVNSALKAVLYAWQRDPLNVRVYMALGICCHLKRWHANAVACFLRVLDLDSNNNDAKRHIEGIEAHLEEAYRHLWDNPILERVAESDRDRSVGALRLMHQTKTEAAYRDLCQGFFHPRP